MSTSYNVVSTAYNVESTAYNVVSTEYNGVTTAYNGVSTAYNVVTTAYYADHQHKAVMAFHRKIYERVAKENRYNRDNITFQFRSVRSTESQIINKHITATIQLEVPMYWLPK